MGINIYGEQKIFVNKENDIKLYSTQITNKTLDGEYINLYAMVKFPKITEELQDKDTIIIKKGFLSNYKTKDGQIKISFIVQEFEKINNKK